MSSTSPYFFTEGDAYHAQLDFCHNITTNATAIIFEPSSTERAVSLYIPPDHVTLAIQVEAFWGTLCSDAGCPTFNMSADGMFNMCMERVNTTVEGCKCLILAPFDGC